MTSTIYPMSRLCSTFAIGWIVATLALVAIDFALEMLVGITLPSGASIGAQVAVAWYAGHRMGQGTALIPDKAWFWLAGLYTALIAFAISLIFLALLALAFSNEILPMIEGMSSGASVATVGMFVLIALVIFFGISAIAHRFVIAHAARKAFDPAKEF